MKKSILCTGLMTLMGLMGPMSVHAENGDTLTLLMTQMPVELVMVLGLN